MALILYEYLKDLYKEKKFSNVQVDIYVEDESLMEPDDAHIFYKRVHAHAIILDMNSPYFEQCLVEHKYGPTVVDIVVKKDKGRFVELMISSFYDECILKELSLEELFSVLEVSLVYAKVAYVKKILNLINKTEPSFEASSHILNTLHNMVTYGASDNELIMEMKITHAKYLCNYFSPIEEVQEKHDEFCSLHYASLLCMLQSLEPIARSENSLFTFCIIWLEYDQLRQTCDIIEGLLSSLQIKYLNVSCLYSCVRMTHDILEQWDGFKKWVCESLAFFGYSGEERSRKFPSITKQVDRSLANGIHGWYMNEDDAKLCAVRWIVHMTPEKINKKFGPTTHYLVHDGMSFFIDSIMVEPVKNSACEKPDVEKMDSDGSYLTIENDESDQVAFDLTLSLRCSCSMNDLHFFIGSLPADKFYDRSKITLTSKFFRQFIQVINTDDGMINNEEGVRDFRMWKVSKDLLEVANNDGFLVFFLPFTKDEYKGLPVLKS